MRKVIEYTLISADGVFEDPVAMGVGTYQDDAYLRDGLTLLMACQALLFGRRTYEAFAKLYGGDGSHKPQWADRLNVMHKYVFSSTMERPSWTNTTIVRSDPVSEVQRLKNEVGGDLLILGHGQLAETLLRQHLTDLIDLTIFPFIRGQGKSFFRDGQSANLDLVTAKVFSKIVKLTYAVH
jgi:dihydrofolate reductase